MKVDFIVKPEFTGGGGWQRATVRINTQKGADAYNAYFDSDKNKGDMFIISNLAYKEFEIMRETSNLSSVFG